MIRMIAVITTIMIVIMILIVVFVILKLRWDDRCDYDYNDSYHDIDSSVRDIKAAVRMPKTLQPPVPPIVSFAYNGVKKVICGGDA